MNQAKADRVDELLATVRYWSHTYAHKAPCLEATYALHEKSSLTLYNSLLPSIASYKKFLNASQIPALKAEIAELKEEVAQLREELGVVSWYVKVFESGQDTRELIQWAVSQQTSMDQRRAKYKKDKARMSKEIERLEGKLKETQRFLRKQ